MTALKFEDVGRTFTCEAASSPATPGTMWWWVSVSGEKERYAAFRVEADDTPDSVRPRVVVETLEALHRQSGKSQTR